MLKGRLLHPGILHALARAGHGSKILIADGNYPAGTRLGPRAELVSLNLSPGLVDCADVLAALLSVVPVEAAQVMRYDTTGPSGLSADPPVWVDYRRLLGEHGFDGDLEPLEPHDFYDAARTDEVALTVATAEEQTWANLLLTIGPVFPGRA